MKDFLLKIAEATSFLKENKIAEAVEKLSEATELANDTEPQQVTEPVSAEDQKAEIEEIVKTVSMNFYNDTMKEMLDDMREAIESLRSDYSASLAELNAVKAENQVLKEEVNKIASVRGQSQQIPASKQKTSCGWDAI